MRHLPIIFGLFLLSWMAYLCCMNSTENRQRLVLASLSYASFRDLYWQKNGRAANDIILTAYSVYSDLINCKPLKESYNEGIKARLVTMDLCDIDQGILVLKGFHIEDSLTRLTSGKR